MGCEAGVGVQVDEARWFAIPKSLSRLRGDNLEYVCDEHFRSML